MAITVLASSARGDPAGDAAHLGMPMSHDEVAWDLTIFPDGCGLRPGHGTAKEGRQIYERQCASCHGDEGQGATAEELVSEPTPPTVDNPSKAIGSYWPSAPTIFDFIRRGMPPAAPGSLSADQVYAVTDKIIGETDEIKAETLPKVKMPNRDGFVWIDVKK